MSTTNTQTQTGTFNQAGMGAYNQMTPTFSNMATGYMNNPFNNPFFQTQQQMGNQQANLMGQSAMSNITRNWNMTGSSGNNPAFMEMMNNQARMNSSMRANLGFLNPVQNAFTAQQNFGQMASQFRPLQTGQTQVQKQSGLGTWLPQVIGMGISAATGGMGGGLAGLFGGGRTGGGSVDAMNAATSPMQSPWMQPSPYGYSSGMGQNAPDVGGYNFGSSPFMR